MENGAPPPSPDKYTTLLVPSENVVTCNNTIIDIGSSNFDSYFYTCFADGTIDIRFRTQYAEQSPVSSSALLSLHIAGFLFPQMATVDELCLSHNMCSAVYLRDGKLEISYACNSKLPTQKLVQPKPETVFHTNLLMMLSAVTLAARHAMAGFHYCCDDLYILMKQTYQHLNKISPKIATQFYRILIRESYRSINFPLDSLPINQNTKGVSSMNLGRVLTMKTVLGTSYRWKKDHMARVAWSELALRNFMFAFSFALKEYNQISKDHKTLAKTLLGQFQHPTRLKIVSNVSALFSVSLDLLSTLWPLFVKSFTWSLYILTHTSTFLAENRSACHYYSANYLEYCCSFASKSSSTLKFLQLKMSNIALELRPKSLRSSSTSNYTISRSPFPHQHWSLWTTFD